MIDVITIGHPTVDIFVDIPEAHLHKDHDIKRQEMCLLWGQKYYVHKMSTSVGGNALNVAVGLTKLGKDASLVCSIGTDFFGSFARDTLEKLHVDLRYVQPVSKTDTSVIMNFHGDRTILTYYADEAYTMPADLLEQDARWVYLTSTGITTFPDLFSAVTAYLDSKPDTKLAFNPGPRELDELKSSQQLLKRVDLLIVNFEEACQLADRKDFVGLEGQPKIDGIVELLRILRQFGVNKVAMTSGGEGAYGLEGKSVYHQEPFPSNIIEKTGAGDAFTTGLLGAQLYDISFPESLRWGATESASVMEQTGAAKGLLEREDIDRTLRDNFALIPKEIAHL